MKSLFALALLGFSLSFCNLGTPNRPRNANGPANVNSPSPASTPSTMKERFLGTWEVGPETDLDNGPITFKSDNTYSARRTKAGNSLVITGAYELRGDRLYCLGQLENDTKDGFKMENDRISLKIDGKIIYFNRR